MNKKSRRNLGLAANLILSGGTLGLFVMGLFLGTVHGIPWALNIFNVIFWLHVVSVFCASGTTKLKAQIRKKGRTISKEVDVGFDFCVLVILAALGWFWYFGFYFFAAILQYEIFDGKKDKDEPSI